MRLLSDTASLAGSYFKALIDFEHLRRGFIAQRAGDRASGVQIQLITAAAVTAFRVATEV